jgi:hypothetical protein
MVDTGFIPAEQTDPDVADPDVRPGSPWTTWARSVSGSAAHAARQAATASRGIAERSTSPLRSTVSSSRVLANPGRCGQFAVSSWRRCSSRITWRQSPSLAGARPWIQARTVRLPTRRVPDRVGSGTGTTRPQRSRCSTRSSSQSSDASLRRDLSATARRSSTRTAATSLRTPSLGTASTTTFAPHRATSLSTITKLQSRAQALDRHGRGLSDYAHVDAVLGGTPLGSRRHSGASLRANGCRRDSPRPRPRPRCRSPST